MVGAIRWGLIILAVLWACYISSESWYPWRDKTDLWAGLAGIGIISLGLIRHAVRTIKKKRAVLESKEWAGPGSYYVTGREVRGEEAKRAGYIRLGLSVIAPLIVAIWLPFNFTTVVLSCPTREWLLRAYMVECPKQMPARS